MSDPNLNKIVDTNIKDIKQGILGTTITQVSSYLDYIYGYHNRDKRKKELDDFIYELKLLSDQFKLQNIKRKENQHVKQEGTYARKIRERNHNRG